MSVQEKNFRMTLGLIRFWRHQRRTCANYLTGETLHVYRQKCTKQIRQYIASAKELKAQL